MQPPAERNTASLEGCPPRRERAPVQPRCTTGDGPPRKQIVLLGASIRPAAQSARRAGLSVTGIDLFGDTDTVAACDRYLAIDAERNSDEIFRACRGIPVIQVGGLHAHDWLTRRLSAWG